MSTTHLDQALAEEFADKAETIHALKASDLGFRDLLKQNHDLWKQIQQIQRESRRPLTRCWRTWKSGAS